MVNPSDLAEATRRAEYLVEHGPTMGVMSQQAGLAAMSVLWVAATAPAAFRLTTLVWFLLAVAGTVVSVAAWVRARRHRRLLPYVVETPQQPLGALTPADRKSVTRQVSGQAPVPPEAVPLVRAMLAWQRLSTRMAITPLIGMGLSLLAFAGSTLATPGPWRWLFVVLIVCTAAFVTVLSMIEKRRRERVVAEIDRAGVPVS